MEKEIPRNTDGRADRPAPLRQAAQHQRREKVAEIINDMIRRGSFRSVGELKSSIQRYLDAHNADPKPFRWTATPEAILSKVENICKTLS